MMEQSWVGVEGIASSKDVQLTRSAAKHSVRTAAESGLLSRGTSPNTRCIYGGYEHFQLLAVPDRRRAVQVSRAADVVLQKRCTLDGIKPSIDLEDEALLGLFFELIAGSSLDKPAAQNRPPAMAALRMRLLRICCKSVKAANLMPRTLEVRHTACQPYPTLVATFLPPVSVRGSVANSCSTGGLPSTARLHLAARRCCTPAVPTTTLFMAVIRHSAGWSGSGHGRVWPQQLFGSSGTCGDCRHQCWAQFCIVGSVILKLARGKYDLFFKFGPDRPTLAATRMLWCDHKRPGATCQYVYAFRRCKHIHPPPSTACSCRCIGNSSFQFPVVSTTPARQLRSDQFIPVSGRDYELLEDQF